MYLYGLCHEGYVTLCRHRFVVGHSTLHSHRRFFSTATSRESATMYNPPQKTNLYEHKVDQRLHIMMIMMMMLMMMMISVYLAVQMSFHGID